MGKKVRKCCICGKPFHPGEWGNNPEPVKPYSSGTCCDECNREKVAPARRKTDSGDWVVRDKEPL